MATIREWLDEAGFDWEASQIVYQETTGWEWIDFPGHPAPDFCTRGDVVVARVAYKDDPILDAYFNDRAYDHAPRFIANDGRAIYIPTDSGTELLVIELDISTYLDVREPIPVT